MADKQGEEATGCTCADWQENVRHLDSLLLLGWTHGREYKGALFRGDFVMAVVEVIPEHFGDV